MTARYVTTGLYVDDPAAAIVFYERAFGLRRRHLDEHENGAYAELETGSTVIAFASAEVVRRHLPLDWRQNDPALPPPGIELGFIVEDVDEAYEAALAAGGTAVAPPVPKPWGQRVGFVRDPNGVLIELASEPG